MRLTGPLAPLTGALLGALGGAIYWLAAQIWPSSVALILSMAASMSLSSELRASPATRFDLLLRVFCLLIKFNALLALSAAQLPYAVPANIALGLIMVCGYSASFALQSVNLAILPAAARSRVGSAAVAMALVLGFVPSLLLGIPGLIGLAAALIAALGMIALLKFKGGATAALDMPQLVSEACFYLGALASWRYV